MITFKIKILDNGEDEVIDALCDTEFVEATIPRARQVIIQFIKTKVKAKREENRQPISVEDLQIL